MSERYISLAEVKEILTEEQEKRLAAVEPGSFEETDKGVFDQTTKAAMDHAQKTAKITAEQAREIMEQTLGISCVGGSESIACKIADILPQYPVEVRAIFSKERIAVSDEDIKEVLDLVSKYI